MRSLVNEEDVVSSAAQLIRPGGVFSHKHIDVFFDDTTDGTLPDVEPLLRRVYDTLRSRGMGRTVLARNAANPAQSIEVTQAAGAFTQGNPIVLASDIGISFGQIPADSDTWVASQFAPHPRAFIRASDRILSVRNIGGTRELDQQPELADDVTLVPLVATRQPSHSLWRLNIDGTSQEVLLAHVDSSGNAIDVRRPRDIWQQVVVPAIANGDALTIYDYYDVPGGDSSEDPTRVFFSCGVLATLVYMGLRRLRRLARRRHEHAAARAGLRPRPHPAAERPRRPRPRASCRRGSSTRRASRRRELAPARRRAARGAHRAPLFIGASPSPDTPCSRASTPCACPGLRRPGRGNRAARRSRN